MGGYIKNYRGRVVSRLTGVEFNADHAEHYLCKGFLHIVFAMPHYTISRHPKSSNPHCHPLRLRKKFESAAFGNLIKLTLNPPPQSIVGDSDLVLDLEGSTSNFLDDYSHPLPWPLGKTVPSKAVLVDRCGQGVSKEDRMRTLRDLKKTGRSRGSGCSTDNDSTSSQQSSSAYSQESDSGSEATAKRPVPGGAFQGKSLPRKKGKFPGTLDPVPEQILRTETLGGAFVASIFTDIISAFESNRSDITVPAVCFRPMEDTG